MKVAGCVTLLGLGLLPLTAAAFDYSTVTQDRLNNPEPENWLIHKGNYAGWNYSPLDQINKSNVKNLVPVWSFSTGVDSGHEAPAIVNDNVMFVTTPYNQVIALEADTGKLLWRYKHDLPKDLSVLHNTNRGVALWGDKVITSALDGSMNGLDAKTGERVWQTWVGDWKVGAYITSGPLAVKGKVFVGPSGGEYGVRGFLQALDADTGEEVWRTYSVPAPGEPGHETWPQDGQWADSWKRGGGSMWMPGNYDPDLDILYWGVGNGSPWFGDQRPGDNLYLASVLALDPDSGAIKGHFQYHWNDSWDWAGMNAPTLVDFKRNGETVRGMVSAQRNGYLYWLKRAPDGSIAYQNALPYVKQNVFTSLDPETGRPSYNEAGKPGTGPGKGGTYCPSLWGGKDWPYEAYNPNNGMLYIPANDNHCMTIEGKVMQYIPGQWWAGVDIPDIKLHVDPDADYYGHIQAWNVDSGEKSWQVEFDKTMNWGSIMTTAGGLIFSGGTNDRKFRAFDADTGELLWETTTSSGIISPPSSFSVDGKQYVAVVAGWGVDSAVQDGWIHDMVDDWPPAVPQGGSIWVFALSD